MGMFDSFIDEHGRDWQTKAFDCVLARWSVGDEFRSAETHGPFQVEIYDMTDAGEWCESFAQIAGGRVVGVGVPRDASLPLLSWSGRPISPGEVKRLQGGDE